MTIKEITDKTTWQNFINSVKPNTFLHDWAWGQTEADNGRKVYYFGVFDESGKQVAATLAVVVCARRGNLLIVPHGPILRLNLELNPALSTSDISTTMIAIRDELIRIARSEKCVVVRACPLFSDTEDNRRLFKKLGFHRAPIHVYPELSWILDVTPSEDKLLAGMKKNTRYGIKKAERDGITIVTNNDLELFWKLYSETARRQNFVPHPKKLIEAQFKHFSADNNAKLYFAYYKGEPVTTALIIFGADSGFYHHGASVHAHSAITPSELVQWRIIQDIKARGSSTDAAHSGGLSKYNFWGIAPEKKTDHAWSRLNHFKKGFGGYEESYVHAQDYSISWKYGITYIIETLRRWKRKV